jgi:hypothetical protein
MSAFHTVTTTRDQRFERSKTDLPPVAHRIFADPIWAETSQACVTDARFSITRRVDATSTSASGRANTVDARRRLLTRGRCVARPPFATMKTISSLYGVTGSFERRLTPNYMQRCCRLHPEPGRLDHRCRHWFCHHTVCQSSRHKFQTSEKGTVTRRLWLWTLSTSHSMPRRWTWATMHRLQRTCC